ncbi:hypothetical protein A2U01_0073883, partial [Trifolium medium]|nr:hypothetical protein [Trifolium medium]
NASLHSIDEQRRRKARIALETSTFAPVPGLTPSSRWEVQVAGREHSDVPVYRLSEDFCFSD